VTARIFLGYSFAQQWRSGMKWLKMKINEIISAERHNNVVTK